MKFSTKLTLLYFSIALIFLSSVTYFVQRFSVKARTILVVCIV
ncbi:hypothetical protein [Candidatus Magnetominusculus dajiuhuensis]